MDELDLDAFIANIELTAPEESKGAKLSCQECGGKLEEEEDGNFTCTNCNVQATNILQLDETELHHDELGRPVYGQRVALAEGRNKHHVDYGWAWSTDEAIAHILSLQLDALERAGLLPELFREAATNMWLKFWIDTVAPHIREQYLESELVPISTAKAMKLRDVEVLVKFQDKIMVPLHLIKARRDVRVIHRMLGTRFYSSGPAGANASPDNENRHCSDDEEAEVQCSGGIDYDSSSSTNSSVSFDYGPHSCIPDQLIREFNEILSSEPLHEQHEQDQFQEESNPAAQVRLATSTEKENDCHVSVNDLENIAKYCKQQTRNLSNSSITILTLNRTLAFIEATARCLPHDDPLFAADIIRACNQRLIPFYGSSKQLPENMKLNPRDRLMFQKLIPPTPYQLTRTATLLINSIYREQLPKSLPAPDLNSILKRFTQDLNLPHDLFEVISGKVSFWDIPATRPRRLIKKVNRRLPQYDRWAFAVLIHHMKDLFSLDDGSIADQRDEVGQLSVEQPGDYFILGDWVQQMRTRLEFILRYDPFVLYHPLADLHKLEATSQMGKYIERILDDRATAEIRAQPDEPYYNEAYRNELAEFLKREIPAPREVKREARVREELEIPQSVKYPLSSAFERTNRLWLDKLSGGSSPTVTRELVCKDFTSSRLCLLKGLPEWCIYDCGITMTAKKLEVSPHWPYAFRLLLHLGAFLCFCEPVGLINQVRLVEEKFHPHARVVKRINLARERSIRAQTRRSQKVEDEDTKDDDDDDYDEES